MLANVNEALWIDFNLDTAVFLDTIAYWVKKNSANKLQRHYFEGRYWTFNSVEAFRVMFPGWSTKNIRTIIDNCIKNELLLKGNFNQKGYDRTGWYTLTDKALEYYPKLKCIIHQKAETPDPDSFARTGKPFAETGKAIPTLLPTSSNNTITAKQAAGRTKKDGNQQLIREMIDAYRETFPDNPQPHKTLISTSLEKILRTFIKRWPEHDDNGEDFTLEAFKRYLHLLRVTIPNFSLNPYLTPDGRQKKNDLQTFCRWNTLVSFLEGKYS